MPKDQHGRYFMSKENIPRRYYYNIFNWVKDKEWPRRRKRIKDEDLPKVDFMTVEVEPEDKKEDKTYITVWGPMNDWDFIEEVLSYDYGDEGSRTYPVIA